MLRDVGYAMQIELTDPAASMALSPSDEGMDVGIDVTDPVATARMGLPAMVFHRIMLGRDSFSAALDRQELTITDDTKAFAPLIAPLAFAAFPRYQEQLLDMGRGDLL
jgi:hypothetical protein